MYVIYGFTSGCYYFCLQLLFNCLILWSLWFLSMLSVLNDCLLYFPFMLSVLISRIFMYSSFLYIFLMTFLVLPVIVTSFVFSSYSTVFFYDNCGLFLYSLFLNNVYFYAFYVFTSWYESFCIFELYNCLHIIPFVVWLMNIVNLSVSSIPICFFYIYAPYGFASEHNKSPYTVSF